jgi:hypothetical protein
MLYVLVRIYLSGSFAGKNKLGFFANEKPP